MGSVDLGMTNLLSVRNSSTRTAPVESTTRLTQFTPTALKLGQIAQGFQARRIQACHGGRREGGRVLSIFACTRTLSVPSGDRVALPASQGVPPVQRYGEAWGADRRQGGASPWIAVRSPEAAGVEREGRRTVPVARGSQRGAILATRGGLSPCRRLPDDRQHGLAVGFVQGRPSLNDLGEGPFRGGVSVRDCAGICAGFVVGLS